MANLNLSEIRKRPGRIEVLITKLVEKTPFETSVKKNFKASILKVYDKNKIIAVFKPLKKNDKEYKACEKFLEKEAVTGNKIVITDGKTEITLSELVKNHEFGGKGAGGSLAAEETAIKQTREAIENAIAENKGPIGVKAGNKTYNDIVGVEKTEGTPKSDFHLINSKGEAVIWISHKDGATAKDFQQWGGISERKEPEIHNHKETQKFIADLKKTYPQGLPPATTIYRHIKDKNLKMLSVYGNKFGGKLGEQNVTVLLQGPVSLKRNGKSYMLDANHVHYNGDSVDGDGFDPVLMAIYKGDRSDAGVKGTRIVISPVGGRKGIEFV